MIESEFKRRKEAGVLSSENIELHRILIRFPPGGSSIVEFNNEITLEGQARTVPGKDNNNSDAIAMSCLDCELTPDQLRRLDGSPSAEKPLEYAIELAKKTSNYLLIINVTGATMQKSRLPIHISVLCHYCKKKTS